MHELKQIKLKPGLGPFKPSSQETDQDYNFTAAGPAKCCLSIQYNENSYVHMTEFITNIQYYVRHYLTIKHI